MPTDTPDAPDGHPGPGAEVDPEELYDRYLDAALAGEADEPAAFLARHGVRDEALAARIEALHRMVAAEASARAESDGPPASDDVPFERLGEYRLVRRLGRGGMGMVYLAEQESLRRLVALKVIRPELQMSPTAVERLRREARALARLTHPNVVGVHGFGEDRGTSFLVMELVPGRGLNEVLAEAHERGTAIPPTRSLRWAAELARALAAAHALGILHRDVKPSNVRLTPDGRAVLLDFGLVRDEETGGATLTETFAGSPSYASPEQIEGRELDGRTDVYSLGVTLYQCLVGQAPFRAETVEGIFRRVLNEDPTPPRRLNAAVSRDLSVVVMKALEKDPARRYASAAALADDLDAVGAFRPIAARPPGALRRLGKWVRRRPGAAAAVAMGVLAVTAIFATAVVTERIAERERRDEARALVSRAETLVDEMAAGFERSAAWERELIEVQSYYEAEYFEPERFVELDELEHELARSLERRELLFHEVLNLLSDAERLDGSVEGTDWVRARLYYERLRRERVAGTVDEVRRLEELVARFDTEGRIDDTIWRVSRVSISSDPPGANVDLFRFVELADLVEGGRRRWVPVPCRADGEILDVPVPHGTWVLEVARGAGDVQRGEQVVALAGRPIASCVLVSAVGPAGRAAGIERLDRLVSADGAPVEDAWDVEQLREPADGNGESPLRTLVFERDGTTFEVAAAGLDALGVEALEPARLGEVGDVAVEVLRGLERVELDLPPGAILRTNASPFLTVPGCRLGTTPIEQLALPNDLYVVRLTLAGREPAAIPFAMRTSVQPMHTPLVPDGTTPLGFVYVPENVWDEQPAFFVQEREVTCAEYLEYLNDRATLATIDVEGGARIRYPRNSLNAPDGGWWPRDEGGRFRIADDWEPDWPVLGVSYHDAVDYARWRTAEAQAAGLAYTYRLPSKFEYQMASHAYFSHYPYGHVFRPHLSSTCFAHPFANPERVMSFPTDRSLHGVYDVCGSAFEWLSTWYDERRDLRWAIGGAWGQSTAQVVNPQGGMGLRPHQSTGETGIRLVLEIEGRD